MFGLTFLVSDGSSRVEGQSYAARFTCSDSELGRPNILVIVAVSSPVDSSQKHASAVLIALASADRSELPSFPWLLLSRT